MDMLEEKKLKKKSYQYFEENLKQFLPTEGDATVQEQFYQFVREVFRRVASNDSSDFTEDEITLMETYHLDLEQMLTYFKEDMKAYLN